MTFGERSLLTADSALGDRRQVTGGMNSMVSASGGGWASSHNPMAGLSVGPNSHSGGSNNNNSSSSSGMNPSSLAGPNDRPFMHSIRRF